MSEELELALIRSYLQKEKTPWLAIRHIALASDSQLVEDLFEQSIESLLGPVIIQDLKCDSGSWMGLDIVLDGLETHVGDDHFRWASRVSQMPDVEGFELEMLIPDEYSGFTFNFKGLTVDICPPYFYYEDDDEDYIQKYHEIRISSTNPEDLSNAKSILSHMISTCPGLPPSISLRIEDEE